MKKRFLAILSLFALFPILSAQAGDKSCCSPDKSCMPKHGGKNWGKKMTTKKMVNRILRKFDIDKDSSLDQFELANLLAAHRKWCAKFDACAPISPIPKSAQVAPESSPYSCAGEILKKYDRDGDGKLDRKELAAMLEDCGKCGKDGKYRK